MSELATDLPLDLFQTASYPEFIVAEDSEISLSYDEVWTEACTDLTICDTFRHQSDILLGLDLHESYKVDLFMEP